MKNFSITTLLFICFTITTNAQSIIRTQKDTTYWHNKNMAGLDFSQIAFVNWNAGGNTSISGLLKGNFSRKYIKRNILWNNELIFRYGVNKQEGRELRKTDDGLALNSSFGFKTDPVSNWYFSGRFNFNTQLTNGYSYPNTKNAISKLFAPAYVFLGVGAEYNRKDLDLNFYFSPLTLKTTIVLDETLANKGAYGVTKAVYDVNDVIISHGKKSRNELGILLNNYWKTDIYKNMELENRLTLYSDYINKFGNIDIDWQVNVNMVVNEYVRANIGFHLIYDDDIKAKKEINGVQENIGPKIQLKQVLGVGVTYNF